MSEEKKKIYVVDTSVFCHDSNSLFSFNGHQVVILNNTIEELDRKKSGVLLTNYNARDVARKLDELTAKYPDSIISGMPITGHNGTIAIHSVNRKEIKKLNLEDTVDNRIIALAIKLKKKNPGYEVILVSQDSILKIKARSLGITAENYKTDMIAINSDEVYSGFTELNIDDIDVFKECLGRKYIDNKKLNLNQCVKVTDLKGGSLLTVFKGDRFNIISDNDDGTYNKKIKPKNMKQRFAWALLFDSTINLLTIAGKAGTGKTLLATAAAIRQLNKNNFKKIIITKSVVPVSKGQNLGFTPGDKDEKMRHWLQSIYDAFDLIYDEPTNGGSLDKDCRLTDDDKKGWRQLQNSGLIEIEAIAYMRGRSIPNSLILVDEPQNLNRHEIKTITTRVGFGTKIIFMGDLTQIDSGLDIGNSGFTHLIEKLKGFDGVGHITLDKGERSKIAELTANIL